MNNIIKKATRQNSYNSIYLMFIFLISAFFIIVELYINPYIIDFITKMDPGLPIWILSFICIFFVLSFIYYNYLCIYIMEEKIKDYGIIISLGYNKNKIKKIFFFNLLEDLLTTIIYALLIGTILYYAIIIFISKLLNFRIITLPIKGYFILLLAYLLIYIITILFIGKRFDNINIVEMITYKKKEKNIKSPFFYQIAGFGTLILGILLVFIEKNNTEFGLIYTLLPMLCFTISTYFLIMSFSYWFISIFKIFRKKYLNNLFFISQLRVNYKKYSKILTTCTILIIFGFYLLVIDINFKFSDNNHDFEKPFDFVLYGDFSNTFTISKLHKFESKNNSLVSNSQFIELLDASIDFDTIYLMPEKDYIKLTGKHLNIQPGQIVVLTQLDRQHYNLGIQVTDGTEWGFQPPGVVTYKINNKMYNGNIVKEIWEIVFNLSNQNKRTYIIPDVDYYNIVKNLGYNEWQFFIKGKNNENIKELYEQLIKISSNINSKSIELAQQNQKDLILFIFILFIVIMLILILANLIMLRLLQNANEEKKKYYNLFSVGYTYKQLQSEINKEVLILFFLPFTIGVSISITYTLLAVLKIDKQLLLIVIITSLIFFCIEYLFYKLSVKKLSRYYLN